MYKTFYAAQLDAIFIKIYDYNGAVIARACVDVMQGMFRTQVEALAFMVVDFREVGSASLQDSDAALHVPLFNKIVGFGADYSSIHFVCILDSANSNNEIILERLNRVKSFYKGIPEQPLAFCSWREAMTQIDAPPDYIVEYAS